MTSVNGAGATSIKQFHAGVSNPAEKARQQMSVKQAALGTSIQSDMFGSTTNKETDDHDKYFMTEFERRLNVNEDCCKNW